MMKSKAHNSDAAALSASIRGWMERFAKAVRERDFEKGKSLCVADIHSFGTVCDRADSLEELAANQWLQVWPATRDFDFDYGSVKCEREGSLVVVTARWTSREDFSNETSQLRRGRVTMVLREIEGTWLATHTHFSLNPSTAPS